MNAASKKILIADDDASIRLVLSQAFTRLGYQVRATGNAATLLKWVTEGEGDLVVTDVRMPGATGLRILSHVRRAHPSVPVILITAFGSAELHAQARRLGAATLLDKPLSLRELLSVVRRLVSSAARS